MDKQTFQCHLCQKMFTAKTSLRRHLDKSKIPCNLQCTQCERVCASAKEYKKHEKEHAQMTESDTTLSQQLNFKLQQLDLKQQQLDLKLQELQELQKQQKYAKLEDFEIIPMQDFHRNQNILMNISEDDDEVRVERVTKIAIEQRDTLIIRKKKARAAITNQMLCQTMEVMRPIKDISISIENMMYELLRHDDPRLHNIYLSDLNRGTVKMYTRNDEKNICYWQVHPSHIATKLINEHAQHMFVFLLDAGIESLVAAILNRRSCLALDGVGTEECPRSFVLMESSFAGELRYLPQVLTAELKYTDKKDERLIGIVNARKDEVLSHINKIIIDDKRIRKCLEECRRFSCLSIMNKK